MPVWRAELERADFGCEGLVALDAVRQYDRGIAGAECHLAISPATEAGGTGGDNQVTHEVQHAQGAVIRANQTQAGGGAGIEIGAQVLASQYFLEVFSIQ